MYPVYVGNAQDRLIRTLGMYLEVVMSGTLVYLVLMLDNVRDTLSFAIGALVCAVAVSVVVFGLACDLDNGKVRDAALWYLRRFLCALIFVAVPLTLIPSTQQAAAIYLIPKIANNERVHRVGDKGAEMLEKLLDDYLDELGPAKGDDDAKN
jgi:hypothetical protein